MKLSSRKNIFKLFERTLISTWKFSDGYWEYNIISWKLKCFGKYENLSKCVMYLIAPSFPRIKYLSPKTIHWCVQQNLNQYYSLFKKKSQYLETSKGVVTNVNIFTKTCMFCENILRQIIIKIHFKIHQINHYSKIALREQHLYYLKFPGIKYYPNTGMLLTNSPNYAII